MPSLKIFVPCFPVDEPQGTGALEGLLSRACHTLEDCMLHDVSDEELESFIIDSLSRINTSEIDALQARLSAQRDHLLRYFTAVWQRSEQFQGDESNDSVTLSAIEAMERVLDGFKIADFGRKELSDVNELIKQSLVEASCISMFHRITICEMHELLSGLVDIMDNMWQRYSVELRSPRSMAGISSAGSDAICIDISAAKHEAQPAAEIDTDMHAAWSHRFDVWGVGDEPDYDDDDYITETNT